MADKIRIRRGELPDLPTLDAGELGFATDATNLYVGNGTENVLINPIKEGVDGYILDGYLSPAIDNIHGLGTEDLRWNNVVVGPGSLHVVSKAGEAAGAKEWAIGINSTGNLEIASGGVSKLEVNTSTGLLMPVETIFNGIRLIETTAPNNEDGYGRLYVQDDGYLYYKDQVGTQTDLVNKDYASVTIVTANSVQSGLFNPFNTGSFGGVTLENALRGVSYSSSTGEFTILNSGIYEVTVNALLIHSAGGTLDAFRINKNNGTVVWTGNPYIDSADDPNTNMATLILSLNIGDTIEFECNSNGGNNLNAEPGSTFNIKQI